MRIPPEAGGLMIVLIGDFDPRLFRPEWFASKEIVGESVAAAAKIETIQELLVSFSFEWAKIVVDRNRFIIHSEEAPYVRCRDLVARTFGEFFKEVNIRQLGINRYVHFKVGFQTRDKIGKMLAPHNVWGEWGPKIIGSSTDMTLHGGLLSLRMQQKDRGDEWKGSINARVEPSSVIPNDGIFMEVNDHYELAAPDEAVGSRPAVDVVEREFEKSTSRSEWIIDQIMALKESVQ